MLKRISILGFLSLFALILSSCSPKHSEIVLAEFNNEQITMDEFENAYVKNTGGIEKAKNDSISQYKDYLDLYVNFKMKLRDAKVRNYDENKELNEELQDYKKKVGVSYLLEKRIVEPGIENLYNQRKYELRVSHIMFRPDTAGLDAAKEEAQAVLDSIKNGEDFALMVKRHSDDNFSKNIGGDIYYVTSGMLPVEFEEAMYETPVGQVYPELVQTRFGYHIIKVTEKRERIPQVRASHILIGYKNAEGKIDTAYADAKMDTVIAKLNEGADFGELAKEYSTDTGTKDKGGDLGFFSRRQMVKPFDEAVFNLKKGEVSGVVKSDFGLHIIKLTDVKPYPPLDEQKEELKNIFQKTRYQAKYDSLVNSLRDKYNYQVNEANLELLANDTLKVGARLDYLDDIKDKTAFSYANKQVDIGTFYNKISDESDYLNRTMNVELLKTAADKVSSDLLLEEEALNLEKTDKEFAELMDDYRKGIYIFKLQEDEVWNKIDMDSTDMYNYYQETKENYVWPDRVNFSEIFSRSDSLINVYYTKLQNGTDFDSLASEVTERPGFKEKDGNFGLVSKNSSSLAQKAYELNEGEISEPFEQSGGFSIIKVIEKIPSKIKTFKEARAEIAGAYQEYKSKQLEKDYLNSLKERYDPVIYYDELQEAFKSEE